MNNLATEKFGKSDSSAYNIQELLDLIKEGHRLLRKQALERFEFLQNLATKYNFQNQNITKLLYQEITNLHYETETLLNQIRILLMNSPDQERLIEMIAGTDVFDEGKTEEENPKYKLAKLILKEEANIMAREELIDILKDDLDLNKASRYRLVSEISTLRLYHDKLKEDVDLIEKILLFNPRFKIIEILTNHQDGMAVQQLATILGKKQYEIFNLIKELEQNDFVEVKGMLVKQLIH
jgi:hypothetical protein